MINDETFYCSPVTPSEPAALCPLVPFICKSGQTFACSEISGAAERVHQLLLTVQVVNSKPTQLTQNEKYSTLDAVRENHLYYFPLNVPSIQMQKYFTFCSRNPPQICSCNSNPIERCHLGILNFISHFICFQLSQIKIKSGLVPIGVKVLEKVPNPRILSRGCFTNM